MKERDTFYGLGRKRHDDLFGLVPIYVIDTIIRDVFDGMVELDLCFGLKRHSSNEFAQSFFYHHKAAFLFSPKHHDRIIGIHLKVTTIAAYLTQTGCIFLAENRKGMFFKGLVSHLFVQGFRDPLYHRLRVAVYMRHVTIRLIDMVYSSSQRISI